MIIIFFVSKSSFEDQVEDKKESIDKVLVVKEFSDNIEISDPVDLPELTSGGENIDQDYFIEGVYMLYEYLDYSQVFDIKEALYDRIDLINLKAEEITSDQVINNFATEDEDLTESILEFIDQADKNKLEFSISDIKKSGKHFSFYISDGMRKITTQVDIIEIDTEAYFIVEVMDIENLVK